MAATVENGVAVPQSWTQHDLMTQGPTRRSSNGHETIIQKRQLLFGLKRGHPVICHTVAIAEGDARFRRKPHLANVWDLKKK